MKRIIILLAIASAPILAFSQNKILINPSVGYAWRTAEKPAGISPAEKKYLNQLSSGLHVDIGAYYLIKPDWGIGLKYNQYTSSAEYTRQFLIPDNTLQTARINTKDRITFVGPGLYGGNFSSGTKHKYISGIAIGVISYKSDINGTEFTGSNLGLAADLGYHYQITPKFSFGPQLGITAGTLNKIKIDGQSIDLPEDSKEGLHRVSLSLGANLSF